MRNCLFCNTKINNKNRSKEHAIPRWIIRRFECANINYIGKTFLDQNSTDSLVSTRNQSISTVLLGNICSDCNNGWMSKLENDILPVFESLWKAPKWTVLTKEQCMLIARWTFKTAVTMSYSSDFKKIIPIKHIHDFYATQCLPINATVDIAYCGKGHLHIQCLQGGNKIFAAKDVNVIKQKMMDSYFITLHFNHVLLRLAWTSINGTMAQSVPYHSVFRIFPTSCNNIFINPQKIFIDHSQFHFRFTLFAEDGMFGAVGM